MSPCPAGGSAKELVINSSDPLRLFLTGPFFVLLLVGIAAALVLGALLLGRLGALTALGTRAAGRLDSGPVIPTLWGLAAALLVLLLAAVLFGTHTLALLGVVVLAGGLALAGLGLAATALSVGTRLADAFGLRDSEAGDSLRLGLWTLGLAAAVPVVGWLVVTLLLAAGIGAVLETLATRTIPQA